MSVNSFSGSESDPDGSSYGYGVVLDVPAAAEYLDWMTLASVEDCDLVQATGAGVPGSAGKMTVTTLSDVLTLSKEAPGAFYTPSERDIVAPNAPIVFRAEGTEGGFTPFEGVSISPAPHRLDQPRLPTEPGARLPVSRDQGLKLVWHSVGPSFPGTKMVSAVGGLRGEPGDLAVLCYFDAAAGRAELPAALLTRLPAGPADFTAFAQSIFEEHLDRRTRVQFFAGRDFADGLVDLQ